MHHWPVLREQDALESLGTGEALDDGDESVRRHVGEQTEAALLELLERLADGVVAPVAENGPVAAERVREVHERGPRAGSPSLLRPCLLRHACPPDDTGLRARSSPPGSSRSDASPPRPSRLPCSG